LLTRILYGLYFLIWTVFIVFAYASLTDEYYVIGIMFGRIFGVLALTLTAITLLSYLIIFILKPARRTRTKQLILICATPLFFLIPFIIFYLLPNNLEKQEHTIQISYVSILCDCARWKIDIDNGNKTQGDESQKEFIYLEAANQSIALPDSIGYTGDIIELTGQFYSRKGFPKGYESQEWPEKERVFRYKTYKIISSNYSYLFDN
jgi:hypothetical protein